jgi:hypothetical protein
VLAARYAARGTIEMELAGRTVEPTVPGRDANRIELNPLMAPLTRLQEYRAGGAFALREGRTSSSSRAALRVTRLWLACCDALERAHLR